MNAKQYLWSVNVLRQAYKSKLKTKLPASAVAAQAILETGYGKSVPVCLITGKKSYNLFGIKCLMKNGKIIVGGSNGCVLSWTKEEINGKKEPVKAWFRAFHSYEESFDNHAQILFISIKNGKQRYAKAYEHLDDAEAFITEVWKAGYCSDSKYLENIIPLMRQLNKIPIWVLKL